MIHSLRKAFIVAALAVVLPTAAIGQNTSVSFDIQPGVPAATFTQVDIYVWTTLPANTFGSSTIDVNFDQSAVSYQAKGSAEIGTTNSDNVAACNNVGDPGIDCTFSGPYPFHTVDQALPGQVRVTITSDIKELKGLIQNYAMTGLQVGSTEGTANLVATLFFSDVTGAASKTAANFSAYSVADTSLSLGFYSSLDNSDSTNVIIDDCDAAGCTFVDTQLPVELSDFTAILDQEDIVLNWQTASETNNAGFSLEYARGDETEFAELTFVEGRGTTTNAQEYTFRASGLDIGRYKFRLRQIDFDGAFEYSEEVEAVIELAGTHRLGAAYPNPFNPSTTFELIVGRDQQVQIDIINALGQRVQRLFNGPMEASEPKNFVFEARMLPTGLYFYRVVGENFAQTRQMLLVK